LAARAAAARLAREPDETVTAKAAACAYRQSALVEAHQKLRVRWAKIDLPPMRPVVTREERYAGHCACCDGITLAAVPAGLEDGSPFSVNIVAIALYLCVTHAINSGG
jgi:transposase